MVPLLVTLWQLIKAIWNGLKDPEFRALLLLVVITLICGSIFYAKVEGWSLLDAFYFSFITLTTIGYGDLSPTTPVSKLFTVVYVIVGLGILLGFVETVAKNSTRKGKRSVDGGDAKTTTPDI
jgi:voltage-gated potassium channel